MHRPSNHHTPPCQQTVPGKVQLAYFDVGGPNVSYHSYDWKNHGSCDLNPCDGQYKNVFRKARVVGGGRIRSG